CKTKDTSDVNLCSPTFGLWSIDFQEKVYTVRLPKKHPFPGWLSCKGASFSSGYQLLRRLPSSWFCRTSAVVARTLRAAPGRPPDKPLLGEAALSAAPLFFPGNRGECPLTPHGRCLRGNRLIRTHSAPDGAEITGRVWPTDSRPEPVGHEQA